MRKILSLAFVVLWCTFGAGSLALSAPTERASGTTPALTAHPALWHVRGRHGTLTLLGSLHLVPAHLDWRTREIAQAIDASDVFVFEAPADAAAQQKIKTLIDQEGTLPQGQSLRALLTPKAQADYDKELQALNIPSAEIDNRRPWLASLVMSVMQMKQDAGDLVPGADITVMNDAAAKGAERRYLETIEQQAALIVPKDRVVELQEFEADLGEMRTEKDDYPQFVSAWATGDTKKLDALMNGGFANYPGARAALLDDRNRAWVKQFEKMLDEPHTYFVTVGAGHLVGPKGVPALLRADGYRVEGP